MRDRLPAGVRPRSQEPGADGGFTMVELIISIVLASVVLGAAFQMLMTNQRMFTVVSARSDGLNAIRATTDILFNHLREVSPGQGDIRQMDADSITIRGAGAFGIVCSTILGSNQLNVVPFAGAFTTSDSVSFLADNDPLANYDDGYRIAAVTAVSWTTCPNGDSAQAVTVSRNLGSPPDSVVEGAPVRSFTWHTYGTYSYKGENYLGRRTGSADPVVMAGPLADASPMTFSYYDSTGTTENRGEYVALIKVIVRTASPVIDGVGVGVRDTTVIYIQPRN